MNRDPFIGARWIIGVLGVLAVFSTARGEEFPARALKVVVPYPISGPSDIRGTQRLTRTYKLMALHAPPPISDTLARTVAQAIGAATRHPVALERQPGGATTRGALAVARAPADGHTLLLASNATMAINPHYFHGVEYVPVRDFVLVAPLATMPFVLMVGAGVPADSVGALTGWLRVRPGEINLGSSGDGSIGHLAGELLRRASGVNVVHVSYNGGMAALNGVATGQVSLMFAALPLALPYLGNEHLKPLGIAGSRRFELLPGLATLSESGLPGFEVEGWFGLFAPARTPASAVAWLHEQVAAHGAGEAARLRLLELGLDAPAGTLSQFATRLNSESEKWAPVMRASRSSLRLVTRMLRPLQVSLRELAISAGPFILLAVALLWLAYLVLDPTPPRTVVLATGPEQGAYAEFGRRYAGELARFGIHVELRTTAGAAENRRLLRDPGSGVDIAFMQSGASDAIYAVDEDTSGRTLVSLGNLFLEPVWLFYRTGAAAGGTLDRLQQLAPLRLNLGAPGSGAANLVEKLLHANRVDTARMSLQRLPPTPAVVALLGGELDVLAFVSSPEAALVRMLLQTPGIRLLEFTQADAYARRFSFLRSITMPRGTVDLEQDVPPADVRLVAATASLVATERLHPALTQLFAQAGQRIHGDSSWFGPSREFPNGVATEFPLAKEADRFYRNGPPLLQRQLPFWAANLIDRMWVVLVSIIAILLPLSRVIPPMYEFRIRSRVFRWYRQLREIEDAAERGSEAERAGLLARLDDLERRVEHISVPLSHTDELYALRSHIDLVRNRLRGGELPAGTGPTAPPAA